VVPAFTIGVAVAQPPSVPQFKVASVKKGGDTFSTRPIITKGRIRWVTQLAYLIGYAYSIDFSSVSGRQLGTVYDIEATFEPDATDDQIRAMLRSLLSDRFNMKAHPIGREADGYAMTLGRGGLKAKKSSEPVEDQSASASGANSRLSQSYVAATVPEPGIIVVSGRSASLAELAATLQRVVRRPVWDQTGVLGKYDFDLRFAHEATADTDSATPPLVTALRESVGLVLTRQKGRVETLVVDAIGEPVEN
jgi:uncharacterized protein (TIGR03435 family)